MLIDLDPDAFDEVMASYLRKCIDTISRDNGELFEGDDKNKLLQSMMVTHDWFAKPSQWFDKR